MKYVIISNRLPVTVTGDEGAYSFVRSGGGLATGLDSLETSTEKHWVGWAGQPVEDEAEREHIRDALRAENLHPVFLSPEEVHGYYEGFSNSTLWPLCHYFLNFISYDRAHWEAYRAVNEIFCREALKVIEPGDTVWIHDYQLMLLPALLREKMPDISIGYFHHIPFPAYEIFRYLPERGDILRGLLGADLVGFHTSDYMRHFIDALYRVLDVECQLDEVQLENRVARIEAFPMGINYELYSKAPNLPVAEDFERELEQLTGDAKLILSVDRLDYSKGILLRLEAFAAFFENNPQYLGQVTMLMIVVPSRDNVDIYADLKTRIDRMVGTINGAYAMVGWTPVHYFYRSFDLPELSAMYHRADVALITPLRDGMNLVAKEYLAAKGDGPGVLILSEMAGAVVELPDALVVNPADTRAIEKAILAAVTMPEEEQREALVRMQATVAHQTVTRWAGEFLDELQTVKRRNDGLAEKLIGPENLPQIVQSYAAAKHRLLLFDYDGTLTSFSGNPAQARPGRRLLDLLAALCADPRNKVVISSGRDKDTLQQWFGDLDIGLVAEHGVFFREEGRWFGDVPEPVWSEDIYKTLERITKMTPRSRIEVKCSALVWHYRRVDPWLADLRGSQLVNALIAPSAQLGLQIVRGDKIIEIKLASCNKGTDVRRLLDNGSYDFILAIGDDVPDEDMFAALPPSAVTVKVGRFSNSARYAIPTQRRVLPFLETLR